MLRFFRSLLLLSLFVAGSSLAASPPFDQAAFDKLQAEGKPILIAVHADWCGICTKQEPIIDDLLTTPALKSITALRVDYDKQKDIVRSFNVSRQSTLIVFKGGKEVARTTGDKDKGSIAALLEKAI